MANSSKIFILILLATGLVCSLILIPAAETHAWEVMTGRIRAMHNVGGKTQLSILLDTPSAATAAAAADPQPAADGSSGETATGNSAANSIDLEIATRNLPPRLKEGDYIRIWSKPGCLDKPWRISCCRGHDPTGVRSRLRGRGRHSGRGSGRGGGKGGHGGH